MSCVVKNCMSKDIFVGMVANVSARALCRHDVFVDGASISRSAPGSAVMPAQLISRDRRSDVGAEDMETFLKKGWFWPRLTGTFIQQSFIVKVEHDWCEVDVYFD